MLWKKRILPLLSVLNDLLSVVLKVQGEGVVSFIDFRLFVHMLDSKYGFPREYDHPKSKTADSVY
jgi:hypothetical protein